MNKIYTLIFLVLYTTQLAIGQNPLLVPSTLEGTNIDLTLQNGTHEFYDGVSTTTMGINGDILGPTILLNKGDLVNFTVNNQIADITTIHWHGMHVAPENDGGPHTTITPNTTWSPSFTIMDDASTMWYHPHLHEKTNEHVSKGMAGMIIVRDDVEAALALPRTYGVDDFPLVIQTKDFDDNKQVVVPSNSDDIIMVNATIDPALAVPEQVVRFRLLNGSSMRVFNIGLNDNQTFYQIASDGGLLSDALAMTRLELAPGERAEILIDFSARQGETIFLKSYASEFPNGIYGATNPGRGSGMTLDGYKPNPLNGTDFNMMQFNVDLATTSGAISSIPTSLVTVVPIPEADSDKTRNLTMTPASMGMNALNGDFLINNVSFDSDVINYEVPLGNTEIWSIYNDSPIAHPFHIHDVQFYVLDRDGNPPPLSERGKKDVILVKSQETVRFITKFEDFTNEEVPYMYHCHMLYHEDRGMMGQFLVVDKVTSIDDNIIAKAFTIYPNPSQGMLQIKSDTNIDINHIEIIDMYGRIIFLEDNFDYSNAINVEKFSKGLHLLKITTKEGEVAKKIILN